METDNPFEKVLDRLREKGWCKNTLGDQEGPNCLLGAGIYALEGHTWQWQQELREVVRAQYPDRLSDSGKAVNVSFNNHPDTTFSDVERVLEKAAVKWEEERVLRDD